MPCGRHICSTSGQSCPSAQCSSAFFRDMPVSFKSYFTIVCHIQFFVGLLDIRFVVSVCRTYFGFQKSTTIHQRVMSVYPHPLLAAFNRLTGSPSAAHPAMPGVALYSKSHVQVYLIQTEGDVRHVSAAVTCCYYVSTLQRDSSLPTDKTTGRRRPRKFMNNHVVGGRQVRPGRLPAGERYTCRR